MHELLHANPNIIGDNCFVGARSEVVEGVVVEDTCVISMGVYIGQSSKIYGRVSGEVIYGRIPEGSVVVAGNPPLRMASTASTAPSSSNGWMPRRGPRPGSMN